MANLDFKIEKDVPLPNNSSGKGFAGVLRKLKKGESVVLPFASHAAAGSCAHEVLGKGKYAARKANGGFRVWRKE